MSWFIKVLRHYADFSGRARRKEYWFFMLFNMILSIAWSVLAVLVGVLVHVLGGGRDADLQTTVLATLLSAHMAYLAVMQLPGMAVAVRRLHDLGKSGWMMLVGLIPLVGGIWLFVLMVFEGQAAENRYGPNPKTSTETFDEPARLRSAGVALIVASGSVILKLWMNHYYLPGRPLYWMLIDSVGHAVLLTAGIFLVMERTLQGPRGKVAVALLLAAAAWLLVLDVMGAIAFMGHGTGIPKHAWKLAGQYIIPAFQLLLMVLFAGAALFLPKSRDLVRGAAAGAIVLSGLWLLGIAWGGLDLTVLIGAGKSPFPRLLYVTSGALMPAALLVVTATLRPRRDPAIASLPSGASRA